MSDVFLDAQIDVVVTMDDSELARDHLLDATIDTAVTFDPPELTRVHPLTATIAPTITLGPADLTRVHPLTTTIPVAVTMTATLTIVKLLSTIIEVSVRVLGQLFYEPAVDPPPAGVALQNVSTSSISMPTPTLDAFGRPVQPWTPS